MLAYCLLGRAFNDFAGQITCTRSTDGKIYLHPRNFNLLHFFEANLSQAEHTAEVCYHPLSRYTFISIKWIVFVLTFELYPPSCKPSRCPLVDAAIAGQTLSSASALPHFLSFKPFPIILCMFFDNRHSFFHKITRCFQPGTSGDHLGPMRRYMSNSRYLARGHHWHCGYLHSRLLDEVM